MTEAFAAKDDAMTVPTSSTEPAHLAGRRRVARNLGASGAASLAKVGIQLILLPVMAHLLGPTEFGLYALALPVVSFFVVIADGGLGMSLAREDEGNTLVWSTAFWALIAIGIVLTGVIAVWGLVLAHVAGQPRLTLIMGILSLCFLFIALNITPVARLTRRGDLVTLSASDLIASIIGAIVAVTLAYMGMGAVSLAVQLVSAAAVRCVILNTRAFVLPERRFRFSTIRHHISTGSYLVSGRLVDFGCRFTENFLFGRFFGPASLGNYSFGNQVPRFVTDAVSNPTWTVLYAQALHEQPATLSSLYARLCRLMALATLPVAFLLSAAAPQALLLLLGPKWQDAAIFIQILAPAYAISVIASQTGAVLLAHGHNRAFLSTSMLLSFGRVAAACTGFWLAPVGVAWAIVCSSVLYAVIMFALATRIMAISPSGIVGILAAPLAASICGAVACYLSILALQPGFMATALALLCGGAVFLIVLAVIQGAALKADLIALKRMILRAAPAK